MQETCDAIRQVPRRVVIFLKVGWPSGPGDAGRVRLVGRGLGSPRPESAPSQPAPQRSVTMIFTTYTGRCTRRCCASSTRWPVSRPGETDAARRFIQLGDGERLTEEGGQVLAYGRPAALIQGPFPPLAPGGDAYHIEPESSTCLPIANNVTAIGSPS